MTLLPVFGISRLRMASDGPGVTTLVGTLGCPLACRYCLNPQTLHVDTTAVLYSTEQLIQRLRPDGLYFAATGGGVTFGGGEPLLHAPFIYEFAKARPTEWSINIETSLNVPTASFERVLPFLNRLIVDIKDMDPALYRVYTGQDNRQVLNNLRILSKACPERVHLRVPLIPSYNTSVQCAASEQALREMGFTAIERFQYIKREH